jgi:hypothetical protein
MSKLGVALGGAGLLVDGVLPDCGGLGVVTTVVGVAENTVSMTVLAKTCDQ